MATSFPGSLDTYVNPVGSDGLAAGAGGVSHASMHANLHDAVEAIEVKVGADGSSVTTSHDYKIAQLEAKSPVITLSGDASGSVTLTNLGSGTLDVVVADDLHNHIISNVDGLQAALNDKLGLTAKAADSELLDSLNSTQFVRSDADDAMTGTLTVGGTGKYLRFRDTSDSSHYASFAGSFSANRTFTFPNTSGTVALTTSDISGNAATATTATNATNAGNADTVDNLHASSFLRSDADDTGSGRVTLTRTGFGNDWSTAQLILNPGSDAGIAIRTSDNDNFTVQLRAGGTTGTGPPRLFVTGDVGGGASVVWSDIECRTVTENSARRFKDNIVSAYADTDSDAIEKVKQIPLSSFNYLDNPSETVVGVVAEDLVDVLPEAVVYRDDEVSSVVTQRITYTALGALKQAISKIEALEARVAELGG